VKDLLILLLIACTVALGLYLLHRGETPPPQDTHTQILKGTHYDQPKRTADCDPAEMTLECNGSRPR
jgi:hypothetical protein